jgi:PPOX class probable F420-dependent enzyme
MDTTTALAFAAERSKGVLITLKSDGRPQASNIVYDADPETAKARISVTTSRAKTNNLQRDPRASLHVTSDDFWKWVVLEGSASFSPVAAAGDEASLEPLRALYRDIRGEHDDWDDYDRAMVADGRMVLTIDVTYAYGQLPG